MEKEDKLGVIQIEDLEVTERYKSMISEEYNPKFSTKLGGIISQSGSCPFKEIKIQDEKDQELLCHYTITDTNRMIVMFPNTKHIQFNHLLLFKKRAMIVDKKYQEEGLSCLIWAERGQIELFNFEPIKLKLK